MDNQTKINVLVKVNVKSQILAGVAPTPKTRVELDLSTLSLEQRQVFACLYDQNEGSLKEPNLYPQSTSLGWLANISAYSSSIAELVYPVTGETLTAYLEELILEAKTLFAKEVEKEAEKRQSNIERMKKEIADKSLDTLSSYYKWYSSSIIDDAGCRKEYEELAQENLAKRKAEEDARDAANAASKAEKETKEKACEDLILNWADANEPILAQGYRDGILSLDLAKKAWKKAFREEHNLGTANTSDYVSYRNLTPGKRCYATYLAVLEKIPSSCVMSEPHYYEVMDGDDDDYEEGSKWDNSCWIMEYYITTPEGIQISCGDLV